MKRRIGWSKVAEKIGSARRGKEVASRMTVRRYVQLGKIPPPIPRAHDKEPRFWWEHEVDEYLGLTEETGESK